MNGRGGASKVLETSIEEAGEFSVIELFRTKGIPSDSEIWGETV